MANRTKTVAENVPGEFFVDTTCIDCDTCRQLAPSVFGETGEFSFVKHQPSNRDERRDALRALLCCPTGSIGSDAKGELAEVRGDFPLPLDELVYYCGYNSPKSFGGNSYFVHDPAGNWLIDSPKFLEPLARRFAQMGGIRFVFLTHRDDVADADKYAGRFGAERIIHREELHSQPDAERVIDGFQPVELAAGFVAIPTPGHTSGHCVLLVRDRFLFTGDHLWWLPENERLGASQSHCWHSWSEQIESMRRLRAWRFEWVLPGHGQRIQLPAERMHAELSDLVQRMERRATVE